jgi:hypothetical protein
MTADLRCLHLCVGAVKESGISRVSSEPTVGWKFESEFIECGSKNVRVIRTAIPGLSVEPIIMIDLLSASVFQNAFGRLAAITAKGRVYLATGEYRGENSKWEELVERKDTIPAKATR